MRGRLRARATAGRVGKVAAGRYVRSGWLIVMGALAGCSEPAGASGEGGGWCPAGTLLLADAPTQQGDVQHVHDPEIVRHGDAYYVFSTNDGIPIRRSQDLVRWERVGRVFDGQLPPWARAEVPGVEAPWAPDVAHFAGRYHLYYSLSTFGSQRSVIGLATNSTLDPRDPAYRWEDRGKVLESWPGVSNHNAIDPNVVLDSQGEPWLSWGSWWGGIWMRRLDRRTGMLSASDTVQHLLATRPGTSNAIEAPYIVRRGAFYYLFVSFDLCCRGEASTYHVRVGRSRGVTGPYLDREGVPMTRGGGTLVLEGYGRVRGPGHNSVLEDGEWMYLVHHFYDAQASGVPKLQVRPLVWDAEGWPLAADPYSGAPPAPATREAEVLGSWGVSLAGSSPRPVRLLAGGRLERCEGSGSWSFGAPWLTTRWSPRGMAGQVNVESSWVSADGERLVGRAADGRLVRGHRIPER